MKKIIIIIIILVIAVAIWYYVKKGTESKDIKVDSTDISPEGQIAVVINLIHSTPGWLTEIEKIARNLVLRDDSKGRNLREIISFGSYKTNKKTPVPTDTMIPHEAKRHLKLRGLADIQAHPEDFKKYPRGITKRSDWLNGY